MKLDKVGNSNNLLLICCHTSIMVSFLQFAMACGFHKTLEWEALNFEEPRHLSHVWLDFNLLQHDRRFAAISCSRNMYVFLLQECLW